MFEFCEVFGMKVVILAGGLGTRLSEETSIRPKPMVEIGGRPIIWHIMKMYSSYGVNEFIICCGYKGHVIKSYFANYFMNSSDVTFDLEKNTVDFEKVKTEPWRVTLVDTGEGTKTGGRLLRVSEYINEDETFCLTYGDGLSNVNISDSIKFHHSHGKLATVTATNRPGRFGVLNVEGDKIRSFDEKPPGDGLLINGGFFVLSARVFQYLEDDTTVWEDKPLKNLASEDQLMSFKHDDFWQPMDTLPDKALLEKLWNSGKAPWKIW